MAARFAIVFLLGIGTDLVWGLWTRSLTSKRPRVASALGVALGFIGAYATIEYIGEPLLMIPYSLGLGVGSWIATEWKL